MLVGGRWEAGCSLGISMSIVRVGAFVDGTRVAGRTRRRVGAGGSIFIVLVGAFVDGTRVTVSYSWNV